MEYLSSVHLARGEGQPVKAIARRTAHHGLTLDALSPTGIETSKGPFGAGAIPTVRIANTNAFHSVLGGRRRSATRSSFRSEGVLESVRARARLRRAGRARAQPMVGDVHSAGFFWAVKSVRGDADGRFDAAERDLPLRRFRPWRMRELGLIARADGRGDSVIRLAPPLTYDAGDLDEMIEWFRRFPTDINQSGQCVAKQLSSTRAESGKVAGPQIMKA